MSSTMQTAHADVTQDDIAGIVFVDWLSRFATVMQAGDASGAASLFTQDGYWRDILAFTWDYRTFAGRDAIEEELERTLPAVAPSGFRPARGRMPPRVVRRSGRSVVEGFFDFETSLGRGGGFVRLTFDEQDHEQTRAWLGLTTLQELRGFEETIGENRPSGTRWSYNFAGDNWHDQRVKARAHGSHDPQVLIVGAGQSGLALAARLTQIGVDVVVVESNARVGDSWRNRYHSLTLHNEVWANSLPYMPFPDTWPTFVPKDKLAGWMEYYAEAMELNVWTNTSLTAGQWDEASRRWSLTLQEANGATRTVSVPHVVVANGSVSGFPVSPDLPGLTTFAGEVMHSNDFTSGTQYRGKRAIVFGTGNSGHDVAQDLHSNGAEVTIVQRGSTTVVSLQPSGTLVYAIYSEGPAEDIDLISAATPYPVLRDAYQGLTRKIRRLDAELLGRLHSVGFRTDYGEDDTGFHMKYLRKGGGYYINVGCSELIANGEIGLLSAEDIEGFTSQGVRLVNGSEQAADLVVFATGYEGQQEGLRRLFGDDVATRVGPIWGHNSDGFMNALWTRTGQPGLWLMAGALMECRLWSKFLALQIKADLEGISPENSSLLRAQA